MRRKDEFTPEELLTNPTAMSVAVPLGFIHRISSAQSLQEVIDISVIFIQKLFGSSRSSLTLEESPGYLKLHTISGSNAIPSSFDIPVHKTFVGRVFLKKKLIICNDTSETDDIDCKMLSDGGMKSCMDAPLIFKNKCIGTLNVAHNNNLHYTINNAVKLQIIANWLASIISLHIEMAKHKDYAFHDELTGIANRRMFNMIIKEKIDDGLPFYMAIIDIDKFKYINDTYGHDVGDAIIREVSNEIKRNMNDGDSLYRIGGDEFSLLCTSTQDIALTESYLLMIKGKIKDMSLPIKNGLIKTSISIGFTKKTDNDHGIDSIFSRADRALYHSKKNRHSNKTYYFDL